MIKKILLTLTFIIIFNDTYSQVRKMEVADKIEIGKISPWGITTMKCEKPKILDITDGFLIMQYSKFLGAKVIRFAHATSDSETAIVGYSAQYSQRQAEKLFNKNK